MTIGKISIIALAIANVFALNTENGAASSGKRQRLTRRANFENSCLGFIQPGNGGTSPSSLVISTPLGECDEKNKPFVFSVTHENTNNTHEGAKNNHLKVPAHMADFDVKKDLGRWLNAKFERLDSTVLFMSLDTINFKTNDVTGWPLQYGHLFFSGRDELLQPVPLARDIVVEFEMQVEVQLDATNQNVYAGSRVLVGTRVNWQEEHRSNTAHFAEFDVFYSNGYGNSFNERSKLPCDLTAFNRCFFDKDGRYAEGREFRMPCEKSLNVGWAHCRIKIADNIKKANWYAPPSSWDIANIASIYIGIESTGSIKTNISIRNYDVYSLD